MQRYRMASWILLIHSIISFTLAAPVAVRDIHGVHANVDVANRIAVVQKRMDSDPDEDLSSDLTSEHRAGPDRGPESDSDSEMESESDSDSDSDDSDGGEAAQQWEEEFQNYEPSDIEEEEGHEEDVSDEEEDDSAKEEHEQSPPHSPESQHPAASMYEDLWSKLLKPRTSTSGAVDAPKREFQETDDTRAYYYEHRMLLTN
jgi:hypothetical protein